MKNLATFLGLLALLPAAPSIAQTAPPASDVLDTIVVTAQRREQNPQDVGIALNVFAGADLRRLGVANVNQLEYQVPNLEIENQFGSGIPSFSLRGVGFRDYATNNAPTVGVYVDDVAYPIAAMTQGKLFDIERVEVLRGPQGTLYGRNTTGGAIKFISAQPTAKFDAGATLELGRFDAIEFEGFVSGPLTDRLRGRLAITQADGGAWQENRETGAKLGDRDEFAARALLEADLTERLSASLKLHIAQDESDGLGLQLFNDSAFGPSAHSSQRQTSFGSSAEFAANVGIDPAVGPFRNNESDGVNLTVNASFDAFSLTYIAALETLDREEFNDFDALTELGGGGVYFLSDATVQSHELRLTGDTRERANWVTGLYYAAEELDEIYHSDFVDSFGPGFAVTTPYSQEVETLALYANGDYALSEQWTFIGGIRFESETRDLLNLGTFATGFGPFNFANGTVDGTLESRRLDTDDVSAKVGIEYVPSSQWLYYASLSRGIKSGGFTAYNTLNPNALTPFDPEQLTALETGFKATLVDGRLLLNAAAFYYDYEDQQVQSAIFDAGTGAIVGRIVNAPSSEIYGVEVEATFDITESLTIGQTFAYKKGEFDSFLDLDTAQTGATGSAVFADRSGQSLGFPELTYQGYVESRRIIAGSLELTGRIDLSYRDETTPPLLGPTYTVDDFWLANADVSVGPVDGPWRIGLWARNLFDEDYDETRNFFIAPGAVADVAAPGRVATYGLRLQYVF